MVTRKSAAERHRQIEDADADRGKTRGVITAPRVAQQCPRNHTT
jgi:hypothetical protein